jgi:chromosome segregation ATPase
MLKTHTMDINKTVASAKQRIQELSTLRDQLSIEIETKNKACSEIITMTARGQANNKIIDKKVSSEIELDQLRETRDHYNEEIKELNALLEKNWIVE